MGSPPSIYAVTSAKTSPSYLIVDNNVAAALPSCRADRISTTGGLDCFSLPWTDGLQVRSGQAYSTGVCYNGHEQKRVQLSSQNGGDEGDSMEWQMDTIVSLECENHALRLKWNYWRDHICT